MNYGLITNVRRQLDDAAEAGNELAAALYDGDLPVTMTMKGVCHDGFGGGHCADEHGERIVASTLYELIQHTIRLGRELVEQMREQDNHNRQNGLEDRLIDWQ